MWGNLWFVADITFSLEVSEIPSFCDVSSCAFKMPSILGFGLFSRTFVSSGFVVSNIFKGLFPFDFGTFKWPSMFSLSLFKVLSFVGFRLFNRPSTFGLDVFRRPLNCSVAIFRRAFTCGGLDVFRRSLCLGFVINKSDIWTITKQTTVKAKHSNTTVFAFDRDIKVCSWRKKISSNNKRNEANNCCVSRQA